MWGTGASSTQCEGAAPASDWLLWERAGKAPVSGEGNGFGAGYADDFALLAGLGLTHHRLSIEWARIEPEEGVRDEAAIDHYRRILEAAVDAGVSPWVCLHHFTLPQWFVEQGAFLVEGNRTNYWARHVDFIAETFGDLVAGWKPVNETNYYAMLCYLGRGFSPGHGDFAEFTIVNEQIQLATAEAAVRLKATGKPVSSVFGLAPVIPLDDTDETARFTETFESTNWTAGLGLFRDGVLNCVGREPVERPDLAGAFDLIGFSYYAGFGVRQGEMVAHPAENPRSPLGYSIWSGGLQLVLDRLHDMLPGTPLLVAEYGIGTDDDEQRAEYIEEGLAITHDAIARGIDVRGFFHWTAVDNYEWLHGYDVSFGIIDADRTVRPSAEVLRREALGETATAR